MIEIGYTLSCEEFGPRELVRQAQLAEQRGFTFALASDHFHPWTDRQGNSPFVWSVLAAAGQATERLSLGTGVTCPLIRIHLAIVAQAAATTAALLPGRLFLGLGTGEHLNEHILGDRWPPARLRLEMLDEAIGLIRELWKGDLTTHPGTALHGGACPPVHAARTAAADHGGGEGRAGGDARRREGRRPDRDVAGRGDDGGVRGRGRHRQAPLRAAHRVLGPVPEGGQAHRLRGLAHHGRAGGAVRGAPPPPSLRAGRGDGGRGRRGRGHGPRPDPEEFLAAIHTFAGGGYTHVYLHQVGPDQEGFLTFCRDELLPKLG